jgi:DNA adenine methylase
MDKNYLIKHGNYQWNIGEKFNKNLIMINLPIKWSGSKRPISSEILFHFPTPELPFGGTFYEPFCGSCSVLLELLTNGQFVNTFDKYICSDINGDLINLWNQIKLNPKYLAEHYEEVWKTFNLYITDSTNIQIPYKEYFGKEPTTEKLFQNRKIIFNKVREQYNDPYTKTFYIKDWQAGHFLFLLRSCFNGLIRYNKDGEFNSSCHFSRPAIEPKKLKKILFDVSEILNDYNVQFIVQDYKNILKNINENDFVFLDPPYSGCDTKLMYQGTIDENDLINFCNNLLCRYALTYNGDRGEDKGHRLNLKNVTEILLKGKNSSYSRLNGKNIKVNEIMYVKNTK